MFWKCSIIFELITLFTKCSLCFLKIGKEPLKNICSHCKFWNDSIYIYTEGYSESTEPIDAVIFLPLSSEIRTHDLDNTA